MDKRQFLRLRDKYLKGECSEEEKMLMDEFYKSYQESAEGWKELGLSGKEVIKDDIYEGVKRKIAEKTIKRIDTGKPHLAPLVKIAASISLVLVAISAYFLWQATSREDTIALLEKNTQRGQKSTIVLDDGTRIMLNSDSKLIYPEHFEKDTREVALEGEAFFEVTRNPEKPFIIRSGDLTTTVLGTSFNIKAFDNEDIAVTVATGKVKVSTHDKPVHSPLERGQGGVPNHKPLHPPADVSAVVLTKAEQAIYNITTTNFIKKEVQLAQHLGWKDGIIEFDQTTLEEAIPILERWYNIDLILNNASLGNCRFSARYKDESLNNILKSFQYILDVSYRFENNQQIILEGKGC
ncbi:MAG: FecR domain-containing protein [Cytophagales bacterium]|nr:FecR domain-containing protein [Cytophagales bacterium]